MRNWPIERALVGDSTMTRVLGTVGSYGSQANTVKLSWLSHRGPGPVACKVVNAKTEHIRGRQLIFSGPYARLFWSQTISSLGDWITLFATFSLAGRISGGGSSAPAAMLVPLAGRILPGLLFGIVGGVAVDRFDRKKIMIVSDIGRACLVMVLVLVGNYRDLFLISFLIEVLSLVRQPVRDAVTPQIIPQRHLMAANGLNLISAYGTAPVGSAVFAFIASIATALPSFGAPKDGVSAAFAIDAFTFILSAIIVMTIAIPKLEISAERQSKSRGDWRAPVRDMIHGFRYVIRMAAIRRTIVGMGVGLFGGGAVIVLSQPFSSEILNGGNEGFGVLVTSLGIGLVIGLVLMTVLGRNLQRREAIFSSALSIVGVSIVFTSSANSVGGASGWVFLAGFFVGIAYVSGFTHLHGVIDDEAVRGRTFAAFYAVARTAVLVSLALTAGGAKALDGLLPGEYSSGLRAMMLVAGLIILGSGVSVLLAIRKDLFGGSLEEDVLAPLKETGEAIDRMRSGKESGEDL